jgi:hypothetical protein
MNISVADFVEMLQVMAVWIIGCLALWHLHARMYNR